MSALPLGRASPEGDNPTMTLNPDWDGRMKEQARAPKSGAKWIHIEHLSKDTQLSLLIQALRRSMSELMVAMLNLPAIAEKLYSLGVRFPQRIP